MKKSLILAAALMMAASGAGMSVSEASLEPKEARLPLNASEGKKRRTKSHAANAIKRFYGYSSDRKGKGQKKREASARQKNGWR